MVRIVAQNKKFDIPYKDAMFSTWHSKDGAATVTATYNGTVFTIGLFNDPTRAAAVLEAITRSAFGGDVAPTVEPDDDFAVALALAVRRRAGDVLFTVPGDV